MIQDLIPSRPLNDLLDDALEQAVALRLQDPVFLAKLLVRSLSGLPPDAPAVATASKLLLLLQGHLTGWVAVGVSAATLALGILGAQVDLPIPVPDF